MPLRIPPRPIEFTSAGGSNLIECGLGSVDIATGYTMAALIRPKTLGTYQSILEVLTASTTDCISMEISDSDRLIGSIDGVETAPGMSAVTVDLWRLVVITKSPGTTVVRGHQRYYGGSLFQHTSSGATWADTVRTQNKIQIAQWQSGDIANFHAAAWAIWGDPLTDNQCESLFYCLDNWLTLKPQWMVVANGTTPMRDEIGNGHELTRTVQVTASAQTSPIGWANSTYAQTILSDNPVAYYRMNEGPENTIIGNGDFEANTTGWVAYGDAVISRVTSEKHAGAASLQVITSTAGAGHGARTDDMVVPTDNRGYALTGWVKAPASLVVRFQNSQGNGYSEITGNDAWQEIVVGNYVDEFLNSPVYFIFSTPSGTGTFYIDEIKLFPLLQDSSGNGNHAMGATGSPEYRKVGPINSDTKNAGIYLYGGDFENFGVPYNSLLDIGDVFTIEAWIKRSNFATNEYAIVSRGYGGAVFGAGLYLHQNLIKGAAAGSGAVADSKQTILNNGSWYHCVFTKNGATRLIYINGLDDTDTGAEGNVTCANPNYTYALMIGAEPISGAPAGNLDAYVSEIAIYPYALNAGQVLAHYKAGIELRTPADDLADGVGGRGAGW